MSEREELELRWVAADAAFQSHRVNCSVCRYNVQRPTARLCDEGRVLFDEAERLLAAVNPSHPPVGSEPEGEL